MGNIMPTSGAAIYKAGANVSKAISNEATIQWTSGAESIVNSMTRFNWSGKFSSLNDNVKHILSDTVSSLVAIDMIRFDMERYITITEPESMIISLNNDALRNISILRDVKTQTFMGV